ncbi:MAG TPA: glycosyl hydrolase family 18 protein [Clostridia bacterium]|nr:glycosyl hydrolase family 18 protein [Clostridia bacterium]
MKNFAKIVVVMAILLTIIFALKYAPDFEKTEITDRTNLVINYTNVTSKMKNKVYVENDIIYLSMEDIKNYYDKYIFYDKTYNRIISTYRDNIAYIPLQNGSTSINDVKMVNAHAITLNEKIYIPISKLEELYNIKITYIKDKNIIIFESLEREFKTAKASKKISVKYKSSYISRTVDKIYSNEKLTIIPADNDLKGWVKVRTKNGKIGYVEEKNLTEIKIEKEQEKITKQVEGNISLVWEYFSEYSHAPERGQVKLEGVNVVSPAFFYLKDGLLKENVGTYGEQYIQWAKNNNYKIWPMVANNTDSAEKKEAFSKIMNDSKLRLELINSIVSYVEKYDLDGINLDFENMYQKDKDVFSRFVIELAPRLKTKNAVFSVDVTAPDGSPDWSLCFNRNVIGNVADYIVFMAYDQNGVSSKTPGTVAGYDWVEKSIKKFLEQEEVVAEKIILGIPFYTRLWKESSQGLSSSVVSMKNLEKNIPEGVEIIWDESCKQNYIQYEKNGTTYKMWLEDEKSVMYKLELINQYKLAGAGFWVKGFEKDSIWGIIKEKLNI